MSMKKLSTIICFLWLHVTIILLCLLCLHKQANTTELAMDKLFDAVDVEEVIVDEDEEFSLDMVSDNTWKRAEFQD